MFTTSYIYIRRKILGLRSHREFFSFFSQSLILTGFLKIKSSQIEQKCFEKVIVFRAQLWGSLCPLMGWYVPSCGVFLGVFILPCPVMCPVMGFVFLDIRPLPSSLYLSMNIKHCVLKHCTMDWGCTIFFITIQKSII